MKKENKKWIPLPNTIIKANLKDYTKLVYAYLELVLVFYFFKGEKTIPSNYKISKTLNIDIKTVNKSIQELTETGLLQNNQLYYFTKNNQLDNSMFNETELFNIGANVSKEIGGFTEVPLEILSSKDLSSGERMSWIRIKSVKLDKIHWNGIATQTDISIRTFEKHVKSLKEKGYLNYRVKRNSNKINDTEILDLELFQAPNANAIKAYEEEQKNESIETTKTIETEEIKATVAEASKAEFDYYYDDDFDYDDNGYDYYYDDDYITTEEVENNTSQNFDESKAEYNSIISNDLEQLNSERKQIVIEMNNNPNKASIYYAKLIEIDEKIEKLNKKAA